MRRYPRKPPRPKTWNSPKGSCRLCGDKIIENGRHNTRKNWHSKCVSIWLVMTSPRHARDHVWEREKGTCQGCGKNSWKYGEEWQVDHHLPLFEANGDIAYWHPDNLRLLCNGCHKKKTAEEATRRSLIRVQSKTKVNLTNK